MSGEDAASEALTAVAVAASVPSDSDASAPRALAERARSEADGVESRLTDETEAALDVLRELLDVASGFTLAVLLAADAWPAKLVRGDVRQVAVSRGWPLVVLVADGTTAAPDAVASLFTASPMPADAVVWFEATLPQHDDLWWRAVALRLNERREALRRSGIRVLLLVMPAAVKAAVRDTASDLWSIVQEALPIAARGEPPPFSLHLPVSYPVAALLRAPREVVHASEEELTARALDDEASPADAAAASMQMAALCTARSDLGASIAWVIRGVALYRALTATSPSRFRAELAHALSHMATLLALAKQPTQSVAASSEAIEHLEILADERPDEFENSLVSVMSFHAQSLAELDSVDEAYRVARAALAKHRVWLGSTGPRSADSASVHAAALQAVALVAVAAGDLRAALDAAGAAVGIHRELARVPDSDVTVLVFALLSFVQIAAEAGELRAVLTALDEAAERLRELAATEPARYGSMATDVDAYAATLRAQLNAPDDAT